MRSKKTSPFVLLLIAIGYFLLGQAGLLVTLPETTISPIWPAAGFALACVYLLGSRALWSVFIGATVLNFKAVFELVDTSNSSGAAIFVGFFTGLGAVLQAWLGAKLLRAFLSRTESRFSRFQDVVHFLWIGTVSALVNSNIGVLSLSITHMIPWSEYGMAWWNWWFGDTTGIYTITPLILVWASKPSFEWHLRRIIEAFLLFLCVVVTSILILVKTLPLEYLFIPWLIWATLRFDLAGATLTIFLAVTTVAINTALGRGSFFFGTVYESVVFVGVFIIAVTITMLILGSVFYEDHRLARQLRQMQKKQFADELKRRREILRQQSMRKG